MVGVMPLGNAKAIEGDDVQLHVEELPDGLGSEQETEDGGGDALDAAHAPASRLGLSRIHAP